MPKKCLCDVLAPLLVLLAMLPCVSLVAQVDSSSESQVSIAPPAVGAAIEEADVVFWFVCPADDSFENGAAFNAARFPDAPLSLNDAPWASTESCSSCSSRTTSLGGSSM